MAFAELKEKAPLHVVQIGSALASIRIKWGNIIVPIENEESRPKSNSILFDLK